MNFAKFLRTPFSRTEPEHLLPTDLEILTTAASFYWSFSHLPFTSLRLAIGTLYSVSLFYSLTKFNDSCSYLSSLLFLLPKNEFVSSFAFVLCSPFLPISADWAFLDCVIDRRTLPERYQNIQENPEYNSVLPFRIILKIFAVNMLRQSSMKT